MNNPMLVSDEHSSTPMDTTVCCEYSSIILLSTARLMGLCQ